MTLREDGRRRVVVESLWPEIDCGAFAAKRAVGEWVSVEADAFTDGHDRVVCLLLHRRAGERDWRETPMQALTADRWRGRFRAEDLGRYEYTVAAWADRFLSWRQDFARREEAADIERALAVGGDLVEQAARRAPGADGEMLRESAALLTGAGPLEERRALALSESLESTMLRHADRSLQTLYHRVLTVVVDPEQARYSTWYELFPRSVASGLTPDAATGSVSDGSGSTAAHAPGGGVHGTFATTRARLPYVARMGFDVLYLPPVHPIGHRKRKGPNNTLDAGQGDPGSPWAVGSAEGGHKAVHPALGTLEDFRELCAEAKRRGIAIALDIAFQCSPDHPYVREHPEWFRHWPDGSVQYAENPPKKYEDIYPFDFECEDWRSLWAELASVFEFWIEQGVTIFRVDNPHTKPFGFWQWLIEEIKRKHPEIIFLAEAFSRPRVMHRLAKVGFTQSYTYFTWRNTKQELIDYFAELSSHASREYFRPNLWPNTPDILHEYLQYGGRPAFMCRVVLAATLGASYGIYGPAFELLEDRPREPGTEEYLDSEKYQLRHWNLREPASLASFVARVNRVRRENPALQSDWSLKFHEIDNEQMICYTKETDELDNIVLVIANLDPHHIQSGYVNVPLEYFGLKPNRPYQVHDLLSDARYLWHGPRNFVALDPQRTPAHVFRLRRHVSTERDFDYFI